MKTKKVPSFVGFRPVEEADFVEVGKYPPTSNIAPFTETTINTKEFQNGFAAGLDQCAGRPWREVYGTERTDSLVSLAHYVEPNNASNPVLSQDDIRNLIALAVPSGSNKLIKKLAAMLLN